MKGEKVQVFLMCYKFSMCQNGMWRPLRSRKSSMISSVQIFVTFTKVRIYEKLILHFLAVLTIYSLLKIPFLGHHSLFGGRSPCMVLNHGEALAPKKTTSSVSDSRLTKRTPSLIFALGLRNVRIDLTRFDSLGMFGCCSIPLCIMPFFTLIV